tara:strand:+ start:48 stop:953 length:906 start_codon:yes stop_codon:yes gene_type:complete
MKYVPPAGGAADAAYVDGNRDAGLKGSIIPGAAVEYPQREIDHVISFFGLTPANTDLQQLRKAIEAAIDAATGAGDTSQYLLVTQARARLPIFPEIVSADGKMNVTSPSAGTVLVPTSVSFQHRGIYPVSTSDYIEVDRTFTTLANKTYHLRWNPTDGFSLEDLADSGYNPGVLAESDVSFDTTYDDMLISRIVTDAGNVATITNLANLVRIEAQVTRAANTGDGGTTSAGGPTTVHSFNFARRPLANLESISPPGGGQDTDATIRVTARTRYSISVYSWAWASSGAPHDSYGYTFNVVAG